ncbi:PP2C family protein-serine/threonine phosphatase [Curtobacterium sp. Leaf183]|uniref:PP2C family protein-serine/threonine phosphatase n=1 Tax=Curtobacterium sp. Leaf183 TaxID=1736291 RepID=UPI0006FFB4DA|nr:SpoIIE family protein phosphatase [Curtobacterium sp. Leaf183]
MSRPTSIFDSALVRQAPISGLVGLAVLLTMVVPGMPVTGPAAFLASIVVVAVATLFAAFAPHAAAFVPVVLVLDFVALALLRSGTGAGASVFTSMVVLPVVWWASLPRRRTIVFAMAGVVGVILAPFVLMPDGAPGVSELVRLGTTLIVFGSVAAVVHELAGRARASVEAAEEREQQVRTEIERAAVVQRSLLPSSADGSTISSTPFGSAAVHTRSLGTLQVAGTCLPAKSVGGDFFDWYPTDDGLALSLGDVMGKGVGAGLIAAAVRTTLRSARAVDDPSMALHRASDGLTAEDGRSVVAFTTLFHARLGSDGSMRWADAGHGLAFVLRADGGVERLRSSDLPLGLGIRDEWRTSTGTLDPGDMLIAFSDGVLDLFGGRDDAIDAVAALARGEADRDPAALVTVLAQRADAVVHDDDVTVVALCRQPVTVPAAVDADAGLARSV